MQCNTNSHFQKVIADLSYTPHPPCQISLEFTVQQFAIPIPSASRSISHTVLPLHNHILHAVLVLAATLELISKSFGEQGVPLLTAKMNLTEPPLDRHMPVFTGKYFPCTGKK